MDQNITAEYEQTLTISGWNTIKDIANRFRVEFPTLLNVHYDKNRFLFRHTDRQRTQASVRAFADGLWGDGFYTNVTFTEPSVPDNLLRPHDNCPLYDDATETIIELDRWQNSTEYQNTLTRINDKLGLVGDQSLSNREILTMLSICQFEQMCHPNIDAPFCGAISPFDNLRFEYLEDIDSYYSTGHGLRPLELGKNMNCQLVKDMLHFLTSNDPNEETVKVFSTHRTPYELFILTLGLFGEDEPLTADNFVQQANRVFMTSNQPMGTNIAVVRYDCVTGGNEVLFLMNERPLVLPGCHSNGLCKISHIVQQYNRFLTENCDDLFCSKASHWKNGIIMMYVVLIFQFVVKVFRM